MATAMASALLRIPVRQNVAMTGEVTLRGRVLPIGGLKEKILAAHRAGITTVLIPDENRKDLKDIPEAVLAEIVGASRSSTWTRCCASRSRIRRRKSSCASRRASSTGASSRRCRRPIRATRTDYFAVIAVLVGERRPNVSTYANTSLLPASM